MSASIVEENDWKLFIGVLTQNEENFTEDWEIESLFIFLGGLKLEDTDYFEDFITMMYRKTL